MTRDEAIARIRDHKIIHKMDEPRAIYISEALDMAIKALEEQDPKTGHWEKTADKYGSWYRCSRCKTPIKKTIWGTDYFSLYCPECGIKMVESEG